MCASDGDSYMSGVSVPLQGGRLVRMEARRVLCLTCRTPVALQQLVVMAAAALQGCVPMFYNKLCCPYIQGCHAGYMTPHLSCVQIQVCRLAQLSVLHHLVVSWALEPDLGPDDTSGMGSTLANKSGWPCHGPKAAVHVAVSAGPTMSWCTSKFTFTSHLTFHPPPHLSFSR